MRKKDETTMALGSRAQEMLMRDVLDGMEDFVTLFGYRSQPCEFEIIPLEKNSICSNDPETDNNSRKQDTNIISFSERKEKQALKLSA